MSVANPLVAGPVDVTTPFSGTFLLEDGESLAAAVRGGDWVAGGLTAVSSVVDAAAMVSDPLGSLIAMGLGWVMDHVEPLKGWMNDLTGDAGEVAGFAATWRNVSTQLGASADDLRHSLSDVDGMDGQTITAYRAFQQDAAEHLRGAASWADAMAVGLDICSTIVKVVHDMTRDAISFILGSVASYATELALTAGLATPLVLEQVATRLVSLVKQIGKSITDLLASGKELMRLLKSLEGLFEKLLKKLASVLRREKKPVNSFRHPSDRVTVDDGIIYLDGAPKMTVEMFEHIRDSSAHNVDATDIILGKYDSGAPDNYINQGITNGYSYFDLGTEWNTIKKAFDLTDNDMFELFNVPFLDDAITARKPIHFSHNPKSDVQTLGDELKYLESHGYRFDEKTMTALPGS